MCRGWFIELKFQSRTVDFMDPFHLNHVAFIWFHSGWQNLEHASARLAIAMHKSQFAIEGISMWGHEKNTASTFTITY